jgi:hypothetical protein
MKTSLFPWRPERFHLRIGSCAYAQAVPRAELMI